MLIARWHLTAKLAKLDDCISILRKWEIDVGDRIGWRTSSIRVVTGLIGASQSTIEYEVQFDNLTDLENAWSDLEKSPHHKEYLRMFEGVTEPGANHWTIHRRIELNAE